MIYKISKKDKTVKGSISLTASKSETNRVLIIRALCSDKFEVKHLAEAQDSITLQKILEEDENNTGAEKTFDVKAAGTTMRFLTAYFSTRPGVTILTGSARMKERPIAPLVNALRALGAEISYLEKEGLPPLKITGKKLAGGEVEIPGDVSSQFISALLLIAPELHHGLTIRLTGSTTSRPYINMTLKIMEEFGVFGQWSGNIISVSKQTYSYKNSEPYLIEADWSAASYYYAMVALAKEADLQIMGLKENSLQGDSVLKDIFTFFGVKTELIEGGIKLIKGNSPTAEFGFDFSDCPDIAQTIAVLSGALGISALLNGLHTLKIKETDRIAALIAELKKMNVTAQQTGPGTLMINSGDPAVPVSPIQTYFDHRMAMSFAPLALIFNEIAIEDPFVVRKSYPKFWEDLQALGFEMTTEK